mgnify:CR=1 FL=1
MYASKLRVSWKATTVTHSWSNRPNESSSSDCCRATLTCADGQARTLCRAETVPQFVIAAVVLVCALIVGTILRHRRSVDAPTQPAFSAPAQVDRADFADAEAPWLVAVFSSASCAACADVAAKAKVLACAEVDVVDVQYPAAQALHRKYHIDAVPIVVVAWRTRWWAGAILVPYLVWLALAASLSVGYALRN